MSQLLTMISNPFKLVQRNANCKENKCRQYSLHQKHKMFTCAKQPQHNRDETQNAIQSSWFIGNVTNRIFKLFNKIIGNLCAHDLTS